MLNYANLAAERLSEFWKMILGKSLCYLNPGLPLRPLRLSVRRGERTDEHPFRSLFQNWDRLFVLGDRTCYINGQRAEIFNYLCLTSFNKTLDMVVKP